MTVAIIFIGNAGSGKSTLLSQVGGDFKSGVNFRKGLTKDISERLVNINGKEVVLMDIPGLFEPDNEETEYNAKKMSEALRRGYDYKIFFILKASNRGPDNAELLMMSKVNNYVRQVDGAKVSFRMIVNQITDREVYAMYKNIIQHDNCQSLFSGLKIENYSFNIKIDNVILLDFNIADVEQKNFRNVIARQIDEHKQFRLRDLQDFVVSNVDLKLFKEAMMFLVAVLGAWFTSGEALTATSFIKAASSVVLMKMR
ncbi:hypothetical protein BGZ46_004512 [Entomortierella lignicola]|nr:hypothetical protein BGZ46_004512 [Entomortierella lignicola]